MRPLLYFEYTYKLDSTHVTAYLTRLYDIKFKVFST
uniref:Uncharacterized protein n=1 Tax=Myoviridae sp. ctEBR14 TaxID=2825060 RepID=A0A8S5NY40_9CAUD|nr:MAG TPA: hypothetical protein [Myoviridae sp. ctEBR14]